MKRIITTALLSFIILALSACSGIGTDNSLPPAPLTRFVPTMTVHKLWSQNVGNGADGYYFRLLPAADNGMIFTGSHNGAVTAVNATTGRIIWSVNAGAPVTGGLAAGGGQVYVGTGRGQVIALSEQTGKINWRITATSEILAPLQYSQGRVYVHTISGNLTALSASTGRRVWRFDENVPSLTLHAAGQPQIAGQFVVAGFANGELAVLNKANGRPLWERHIALPTGNNPISKMVDITVNPVVVDGIVYVATYQGQVTALDLQSGQIIWRHKISSYAGITADSQRVYVSDATSHVWAFDQDSGAVDWKVNTLRGRQITGPVLFKNAVVVADRYGFLHFMSRQTGKLLARVSMGDESGALAQPIVYQNRLYAYTSNGYLLALS